MYDAVPDVVESVGLHRSDFQNWSVRKGIINLFLGKGAEEKNPEKLCPFAKPHVRLRHIKCLLQPLLGFGTVP